MRHWHFSEAVDYIRTNFEKFLKENKAAAAALGTNQEDGNAEDNLKQMKDTIAALPVFQEMKAKYSVHINICQECKNAFEKRKLDAVAAFEQVKCIVFYVLGHCHRTDGRWSSSS